MSATQSSGYVQFVVDDGKESFEIKYCAGRTISQIQRQLQDAAHGQVPDGSRPVIHCTGSRLDSKANTDFEVVATAIACGSLETDFGKDYDKDSNCLKLFLSHKQAKPAPVPAHTQQLQQRKTFTTGSKAAAGSSNDRAKFLAAVRFYASTLCAQSKKGAYSLPPGSRIPAELSKGFWPLGFEAAARAVASETGTDLETCKKAMKEYMRESRTMIDNAINPDPAKEGKGKKYSDKGLKEHASYGSTWNSVYKHHRKEGTVPNDPLFDFMRDDGRVTEENKKKENNKNKDKQKMIQEKDKTDKAATAAAKDADVCDDLDQDLDLVLELPKPSKAKKKMKRGRDGDVSSGDDQEEGQEEEAGPAKKKAKSKPEEAKKSKATDKKSKATSGKDQQQGLKASALHPGSLAAIKKAEQDAAAMRAKAQKAAAKASSAAAPEEVQLAARPAVAIRQAATKAAANKSKAKAEAAAATKKKATAHANSAAAAADPNSQRKLRDPSQRRGRRLYADEQAADVAKPKPKAAADSSSSSEDEEDEAASDSQDPEDNGSSGSSSSSDNDSDGEAADDSEEEEENSSSDEESE